MFQTASRVVSHRRDGEDRVAVIPHGDTLILVVADGAGGLPGGREAADIVVQSVQMAVPRLRNLHEPETWRTLLEEIDVAVEQDSVAGETTAVVVSVSPSGVVGASVGDSEAWLVMSDYYNDLTGHQNRKPFLGQGAAWPLTFHAELAGTLIIATDGLFKYADANKICLASRHASLEDAVSSLVGLVRLPSGDLWDDVSMIACRH